MSNEHNSAGRERDDALPSLEQIARLDAFLEHLGAERRPAPQCLTPQETTERVIAAQLRLACAGVEEPTPQDNPLLTLDNFIAAPHVAGVTREAVDRMAVVAVQNILSVLDGKPNRENVVNREVLQ